MPTDPHAAPDGGQKAAMEHVAESVVTAATVAAAHVLGGGDER